MFKLLLSCANICVILFYRILETWTEEAHLLLWSQKLRYSFSQDFASHPHPEPDGSILLHLLNCLDMSKNLFKTETVSWRTTPCQWPKYRLYLKPSLSSANKCMEGTKQTRICGLLLRPNIQRVINALLSRLSDVMRYSCVFCPCKTKKIYSVDMTLLYAV